MRYLLEPGDAVRVKGCAPEDLRTGDVALFIRWTEGIPAGYVIHRVIFNFSFAGRRLLISKGDSKILPDWPPTAYQAAGLVTAFERGGQVYPVPRSFSRALFLVAYSLVVAKAHHFFLIAAPLLLKLARFLLPAQFGFLLNPVCLAMESCVYPEVLKLAGRPALPGPSGSSAPGAVKSGRIISDETWSGRVVVADYLTIGVGVTVKVLPGTEILFERREPWFLPVLRAGCEGEELQLESAGAKILVYGSLVARGEPGKEIIFSGPAFSGVHALGSGTVDLERSVLKPAAACAFSARDSAAVAARGCAVFTSERGGEFYGSSLGTLENCLFSGGSGPGLIAGGNSALTVYGGEISSSRGPAAEITDESCAAFSGLRADSCASGFQVSGRARILLDDCRVRGGEGRGLLASGRAAVTASRSEFSDSPGGVRGEDGAELTLRGCSLSTLRGPALELSGRVSGRLSRCVFRGGAGPSVDLLGHTRSVFEICIFAGGETGLRSLGRSELKISGCSFNGNSGTAVLLERSRRVEISGCDISYCASGLNASDCERLSISSAIFSSNKGPALLASGRGDISLSGSVLRQGASGGEFGGTLRAEVSRCRFEALAGAALAFSGRVFSRIEGSSFSGCGAGVEISSLAETEAGRCSFSDNGGPSFALRDAALLKASGCRSGGAPAALLLAGGAAARLSDSDLFSSASPCAAISDSASLSALSSSIASGTDSVYASGGSGLELRGCGVSSRNGAALDLSLGEASLSGVLLRGRGGIKVTGPCRLRGEGVEISASDYAVDASGASLCFSGLRSAGGRKGGILISGGRASLRQAAITEAPYPGLVAEGADLISESVSFGGRPWHPPAAGSKFPLRPLLFRFAAATARLPVFSAAYRLIYRAGALAAGIFLKPSDGGSVYLYRGMAVPGWVAGLSDMDLALMTPALSPPADWEAFSSTESRLRFFRKVFPFTGEVLQAPAAHFSSFMKSWGIKGSEFVSGSRLLGGSPAGRTTGEASSSADQTEAFYAYTLLLGHLFSPDLPRAFRARNCAKGLIDIKRYLDRSSPLRGSRSSYGAAAGLSTESPPDPADAAYDGFRALHLACPAAPGGTPAEGSRGGWFNRYAFDRSCAELSGTAGFPVGVALESLYRVYLVLPDEAAGDRALFDGACSAFLRARGSSALFSASPVLLSRSSFARLCALPYLNNPLFALDLAGGMAGDVPEDGGVFCSGIEAPPAPAGEALHKAAALAARHFSASWRGLWYSMPAHYFYTRAAGLRLLLEQRVTCGFSDPRLLGEKFRDACPGSPGWKEFRKDFIGRTSYEFVSEQAAAIMEGLND